MVSSIILAAGSGKRMGKSVNKVFLDLAGHPVLFYSIRAFQQHQEVDEIILVMKEEERGKYQRLCGDSGFYKVKGFAQGGAERMHSVRQGLAKVSPQAELVLIHDGARPFVTEHLISEAIRLAGEYGAACPAVVPKDTIKVVGADGLIQDSLPRDSLRAVQTPQAFQRDALMGLMDKALLEGRLYTDDTAIFTDAGLPVYLFPGDYDNLKLTTEGDLVLARIMAGNGL